MTFLHPSNSPRSCTSLPLFNPSICSPLHAGGGLGMRSSQGSVMAEPAHYIVPDGEIELNAGRPTATVRVRNTGDRPVQVGSHYHFFEANRELDFDRRTAYGMR